MIPSFVPLAWSCTGLQFCPLHLLHNWNLSLWKILIAYLVAIGPHQIGCSSPLDQWLCCIVNRSLLDCVFVGLVVNYWLYLEIWFIYDEGLIHVVLIPRIAIFCRFRQPPDWGINSIQVREFQEHSIYAKQDTTVMCPYTDVATHYIFSHACRGLILIARMSDVIMTCNSYTQPA